jgi:hypothetical protein
MKERTAPPQNKSPPVQNVAGIPPVNSPLSEHERAVIAALRDIAYGEIEVVVHNTRIMQITRSQKFRFSDR